MTPINALPPAVAPVPWRLPVIIADGDGAPTLSPAERTALWVDGQEADPRGVPLNPMRAEARAGRSALTRLNAPLRAVQQLKGASPDTLSAARRILFADVRRLDRPYWAWSPDDWHAFFGASSRAFARRHGPAGAHARNFLLVLAYLLGGLPDLRPVGLAQGCWPVASAIFGRETLTTALERVIAALCGPAGLGYTDSPNQRERMRWVLCQALLANRSPRLDDLAAPVLQRVALGLKPNEVTELRLLERALHVLGILARPTPTVVTPRAGPAAAEGVPPTWAAWCWAWAAQDTHYTPKSRRSALYTLFAVGRWLVQHHPSIVTPEQWDEELALTYVHWLCTTARVGDDATAAARAQLQARGLVGGPYAPRAIDNRLVYFRTVFAAWQDRPHAVDGAPARTIPIRFKPGRALATPRAVADQIQPDPRDIALPLWYKLAYAAATLSQADLDRRGMERYPLALYRALGLLWVTAARRPNELARLRVGCVRREWDPAMLAEDGEPLGRAEGEFCYLQVPLNKTTGPFWIWIPTYTADAIASWARERPALQGQQRDPKDQHLVDLLFAVRERAIDGQRFLNRQLIPLLCSAAGVPEADARGQITGHRGRSTRATLLRRLGVPLADIAAYLGHTNDQTVRHYARTDDTQLALTIKQADERSRLVDVLFDPRANVVGQPSVFFFLGRGSDGTPRYCANPAWASCPHRLACLKCRMFVGGTAAELLEAREGVLRLVATVPMNPEEQAAATGDAARLEERLDELRGIPPPAPPNEAFIFNPPPAPPVAPTSLGPSRPGDRRADLTERLARARRDLAEAEDAGKRTVLVRALRTAIARWEDELAALPATAPPLPEGSALVSAPA